MVHQGISRMVLRGTTYDRILGTTLVIEPSFFVEGDLAEWLALLLDFYLLWEPICVSLRFEHFFCNICFIGSG
jgi:hypothetical protein